MKKLYRKGTVHPSPPIISDHLSFLPSSIITLSVALSPEDKQVLAYLISSSNNNFKNPSAAVKGCSDHPPVFNCDCFGCYTSYWVRWDSSPNRQLIHEIIDAYEESLAHTKKESKKKNKKKKRSNGSGSGQVNESKIVLRELDIVRESSNGGCDEDEEEMEKGSSSVRRIMNFIGERIWGVV